MEVNAIIKSVLHSDTVAYKLTSDWDWNNRGNAPLSLHISQYETYGDGTCQHSNSWPAQFSDLTDVCLSFTRAVCEDPNNEAWHQLSYVMHSVTEDTLRFALSIVHRDDKAQWYNMSERKMSSSESKRHDKRWEHVESWMDGTAKSALSIVLNANASVDWFSKLAIADDLRTLANFPCWEDYFKPASELTGDWHQAFNAFRAACRAVQSLDYARRASASAEYNTRPKAEAEPVAA